MKILLINTKTKPKMQTDVVSKLKKQKGREIFLKDLESADSDIEFRSKNIKYDQIAKMVSWDEKIGNTVPPKIVLKQSNSKKNIYISYNGVCVACETVDKGIEILPILDGISRYPQIVATCLKKRVGTKNIDRKDILTRNAFTNGTFIYVHNDAFIKKEYPAEIYIYSSIDEEGSADVAYNMIVIGKNNNVKIHDEVLPVPLDEIALSSTYSDIFVFDESKLTYTALQNGSDELYTLSTKEIFIGKDSEVTFLDILINGKTITQKIHAFLQGENSDFHLQGISLPSKNQIFETYALIYNLVKHTQGKVLYKNVLLGKSKNFFDGMIKVAKGADLTNSYLEDHTVLLSNEAIAESIPGLEIEADDVRASHGATIGSLDKDMMFYAMSRGLNTEESKKLIISGFLRPILDKLNNSDLEIRILSYFADKMDNATN